MNQVPVNEVQTGILPLLPSKGLMSVDVCGQLEQEENMTLLCSDSCSPESVIALKNAYRIVRDRYNKLKAEHNDTKKLLKLLQKHNHLDEIHSPSTAVYEMQSPSTDANKMQTSSTSAQWNESHEVNSSMPVRSNDTISRLCAPNYDVEPQSTSILIGELEQLREKLDRLSREAQCSVDADLKDMMVNVIPKLKELERQFSSISNESPKLQATVSPWEVPISFTANEKKAEVETLTGNDEELSDNFNVDYRSQNGVILMRDLKDLLSETAVQFDDLTYICKKLREQNEKLIHMKTQYVTMRHIPKSDIANINSSETSDWSIIPPM